MSDGPALDCVIGLGSNLGDRRATLAGAVRAIAGLGSLSGVSALYETRPVGPAQPDYLNAAVRAHVALAPRALLDSLLGIERVFGREREERWGPRTLDLDILWVRDRVFREPGLRVPHPELTRRAFALMPLLDVAPDAREPDGRAYNQIVLELDRTGVRELPGTRAGWAE